MYVQVNVQTQKADKSDGSRLQALASPLPVERMCCEVCVYVCVSKVQGTGSGPPRLRGPRTTRGWTTTLYVCTHSVRYHDTTALIRQ